MTRLARLEEVYRLDLGFFVRPAAETGTGRPRVEPVYAYVIPHPELTVVYDTGIGAVDPETEVHYQPHRRSLAAACRNVGIALDAIDVVVNSHLHFDHCGANPALAGRRIVVQASELEAARGPQYTFPELVDFTGATYDVVDGEVELADGLVVIPTPGHSPGHQSLAVQADDGTLLVAGQAMDYSDVEDSEMSEPRTGPTEIDDSRVTEARMEATRPADSQVGESAPIRPTGGCASAWASAVLARQSFRELGRALAPWPGWFERIERFDPAAVVFAHDAATVAR